MQASILRGKICRIGLACAAAWMALCTASADELSHAEGMEELRERMRLMEALVFERTLTPLAVDRERARRADEIAELASELAAAATELATAREDAIPDPARRTLFLDNARRLGAEAAELSRVAADRNVSQISAQIERLGYACAACHSDFRPAAGQR